MKKIVYVVVTALVGFALYGQKKQPNILFIIADDISRNSMGAYGCNYIATPGFDRLAKEGVLFTNAITNNPKCAPSRAMLLTGRYSWQLEESCNHNPIMSAKWIFYPDILAQNGYFVGHAGKGWGPGLYAGNQNPAGPVYEKYKLVPPYKHISNNDYVRNFEDFLQHNSEQKPFCFWLGTNEAHPAFEEGAHLKAGIDPNKIKVQKFFPNNDIVRNNLADYGVEVAYHDQQVVRCLKLLEARGELENTIIIATSDHGMAFPHIKGQLYQESFQVPFAVRWGSKIEAGRVIDDFINFPDVAPTLLEIAGIMPHKQMTGKSFLGLLLSDKSGKLSKKRSFALVGKERHDIGRTDGQQLSVGYPIRGIRKDNFLYLKNYKPNRWPAGDPEYGYLNCGDSPTKSYLTSLDPNDKDYPYYLLSFGKRKTEELYDVVADPDCTVNLVFNESYSKIKSELYAKMDKELKKQKDPRVLGTGDIFDYYPHAYPDKQKELYKEKYIDMQTQFNNKYNNN